MSNIWHNIYEIVITKPHNSVHYKIVKVPFKRITAFEIPQQALVSFVSMHLLLDLFVEVKGSFLIWVLYLFPWDFLIVVYFKDHHLKYISNVFLKIRGK